MSNAKRRHRRRRRQQLSNARAWEVTRRWFETHTGPTPYDNETPEHFRERFFAWAAAQQEEP